jgi:7-keto-8-aminopelargonate synthetase-like enzyme
MMPALLFAYTQGQALYLQQQKQLRTNIHYFNKGLPPYHPFDYLDTYPCYCSQQAEIHEYLAQHGIMTAHFSYPKATDPAITRLVITALQTQEDLDYLHDCLQRFVISERTIEKP